MTIFKPAPKPAPIINAKIICHYLGSIGKLDPDLAAADQVFGYRLAKNNPVLYRGYIYWAQFIVDVLKGNTDVGFIGLNLVSDPEKRKQINSIVSNALLNYGYPGFVDWAEYMAYKVGKFNKPNYSGAAIYYWFGILSLLTGIFIKDPKCDHTTTKATIALGMTLLGCGITTITSPLNKLYYKFKDMIGKSK